MKKIILFFLSFLFLYNISFSQEEMLGKPTKRVHSEFSTRIGLNSLNEINLHYEFFREGKPNILAAIAYHYLSKINLGSGFLCNKTLIIRKFTHRRGFSLRAGANYSKEGQKVGKRIYGVYTYGKARRIINDQGCNNGSSSTYYEDSYEEYDLESNRLGILHYFDFNKRNKYIDFYLGIGLFVEVGRRTNQMKRISPYPFLQPVHDETHTTFDFAFDLGMKINLFRLKVKSKS